MKTDKRLQAAIARLIELAPTIIDETDQVKRLMAYAYLHGKQDAKADYKRGYLDGYDAGFETAVIAETGIAKVQQKIDKIEKI